MPSLAQILGRKLGLSTASRKPGAMRVEETSEDQKIYNPIKAKVGGVITIDELDLRGLQFAVVDIREWQAGPTPQEGRTLDSAVLVRFVDYTLLARPIGGVDKWLKLRLAPESNSDSGYTHRAVVLHLYDDVAHNDGLEAAARDETLKFIVDDDKNDADPTNDEHSEYWRIGDVQNSYLASVKVLTDENHDGKISRDEIKYEATEFWDFSRLTDVDGVEAEQLLFVEMNTHFDARLPEPVSGRIQREGTGWFKIWRGAEVNPEKVQAY